MILRFILGSLLALIALPSAIYVNGGDPWLLVDAPSLALSVLAPLGVVLAAHGPRGLIEAFACALARARAEDSRLRLRTAKAFFRDLGWAMAATGLLGFFLGALDTLVNLADKSAVGKSFAYSLAPLLQESFFLIAIVLPLSSSIDRKLAGQEPLPAAVAPMPPGRANLAWIALGAVAFGAIAWRRLGTTWLILDTASLMLAVVVPLAASLVSCSPSDAAGYVSIAFGKKRTSPIEPADLSRALSYALFLVKTGAAFSGFGVFLGGIYIIRDINDKHRIGPSMAMSILCALYGLLFIILFCLPFYAALKRRAASAR